tara:strand:+ start:202 stop:546 length:345 start_codon:yes stop_codon:yes gene_type:complete
MSFTDLTNAIQSLKPSAGFTCSSEDGGEDTQITEEVFNKIEWVTGEAANKTAITTTVNPHPELTWSAVDAEMARLQIEDDNEKTKQETDKVNANQKLKDLGLTDDEIKAIKGIK